MHTLDIYKNKLICEERTCIYCHKRFAIEKYYPYQSCPKCRKKEEYASLAREVKCKDCGVIFTAKIPGTVRCKACATSYKATLQKTKCSKCGKNIYDVQDDGMCAVCRRSIARKLISSKCRLCGKPTAYHHTLCSSCLSLSKLQACAKPCKVCGTVFVPPSLSLKNTPYCSDACAAIAKAKHTEARMAKLGTNAQLADIFKQALIKNPTKTNIEICTLIGISVSTFHTRKINLQAIRDELGFHIGTTYISHSKFELKVKAILEDVFNGYTITWQKTFPGLKDKKHLRFDFFIDELNLLIEADGNQHFYNSCVLNYTDPRPHDAIKNKYALDNKINLVRIMYFESRKRCNELVQLLENIRCTLQETAEVYLFNCWNGGDKLLPISSQASSEEGSETIPEGSRSKQTEMGDTLTCNDEGEDIVRPIGNT